MVTTPFLSWSNSWVSPEKMKKTLLAAILLMGCGQISQPSILTQAPEPTVVPGLPGVSSRGLLQARRDAAGLGSQSQGVVSGDFNRDGLLDMVVPSFDDNLVNLFLNRGEGFFHPAQTRVLEGDGLWAVASGDLNGDGNLDLVFTQLQSDRVVALLGDGRGGFASPVFTDAPGFPTGVSLADFTGWLPTDGRHQRRFQRRWQGRSSGRAAWQLGGHSGAQSGLGSRARGGLRWRVDFAGGRGP